MVDLEDFSAKAEHARLFPALADSNKERRLTSIFLAVLCQVPDLAREILATAGVRIGVHSKLMPFVEVVFNDASARGDRPDGMIIVKKGKTKWTALIETKIGKSNLAEDQVERYVDLARTHDIDAVITISNQFVSSATDSPVSIPKTKLRKVGLFHWSWSWIATICEVMDLQDQVDDQEQSHILQEFISFLSHPSTGVERFTQMPTAWKDVVQCATNGTKLKKTAQEVEDVAASWISEERDLSLHLSSALGTHVSSLVERKLAQDPGARLKKHVDEIVDEQALRATFRVPDCASDIRVTADLQSKTITSSMSLRAPSDRKSTKARVNWLIRMLPTSDSAGIMIRALWPGSSPPTSRRLSELREAPDLIQTENPKLVPHGFEVFLMEDNGKRFVGRKTFVEALENNVHAFYENVGAHLKAWQPPPPKPFKRDTEIEKGSSEETEALSEDR